MPSHHHLTTLPIDDSSIVFLGEVDLGPLQSWTVVAQSAHLLLGKGSHLVGHDLPAMRDNNVHCAASWALIIEYCGITYWVWPGLLLGRRRIVDGYIMSGVRLTWSLTPHSPAGSVAPESRRHLSEVDRPPAGPQSGRVDSSPPAPDSRGLTGQDLLLSRTMLSNHELPYVGRFACDWLRLATTDPHAAHAFECTPASRQIAVSNGHLQPTSDVSVLTQGRTYADAASCFPHVSHTELRRDRRAPARSLRLQVQGPGRCPRDQQATARPHRPPWPNRSVGPSPLRRRLGHR